VTAPSSPFFHAQFERDNQAMNRRDPGSASGNLTLRLSLEFMAASRHR
jgi:hypothetical protein